MEGNLKDAFERAKEELIHLYYRWIIFEQLFATNMYRIDLINKTAPNVLVEYQWLVIDHMILALSKLTDPSSMRGSWNLSLTYIEEEIRKTGAIALADELSSILSDLKDSLEHFRTIRNKRIAHNDLAVALNNTDSPLPGVSRADINKALSLTASFLNKIDEHYTGSEMGYEHLILPHDSDGRTLLILLQKALAYDQLEDDGIVERGKWRELGDIDKEDVQ